MKRKCLSLLLSACLLTCFGAAAHAGGEAVAGLIIGAGSGAIIGQAVGGSGEAVLVGAAAGGALGFIVGSEIGDSHRHARVYGIAPVHYVPARPARQVIVVDRSPRCCGPSTVIITGNHDRGGSWHRGHSRAGFRPTWGHGGHHPNRYCGRR